MIASFGVIWGNEHLKTNFKCISVSICAGSKRYKPLKSTRRRDQGREIRKSVGGEEANQLSKFISIQRIIKTR